MEYQLTAELAAPSETPDLDPLQQVGVVALLDDRLGNLLSIEGPEGVEIIPVEHSIEGHLGGAVVNWLLDAPTLVFAEGATRAVLEQLIEEIDLLEGWEVKHCAVTATDDQLANALAASAEPFDAEDTDLPAPGGGAVLLDAEDAEEIEAALSEAELTDRRATLLRTAGYLRSFELDAFGAADHKQARYLAGALLCGVEMLIDELFGDVQLLDDEDATADEVEALWVLDELPRQYADRYNALFAKQFLVATSILGHRLTREEWNGPLSVAEALALSIAEARAEVELDLAEVLDVDDGGDLFAAFNEQALGDFQPSLLYDVPEAELTRGLVFANWFQPRGADPAPEPHPYLAPDDGTWDRDEDAE